MGKSLEKAANGRKLGQTAPSSPEDGDTGVRVNIRKKVFIQPIHESGIKLFGDEFEVVIVPDPSIETLKREIKGVEGVIVRTAPFTREIIEAADSLRVLPGTG